MPWWGPEPQEGRKGLGETGPALLSPVPGALSSQPAPRPPGTGTLQVGAAGAPEGQNQRIHRMVPSSQLPNGLHLLPPSPIHPQSPMPGSEPTCRHRLTGQGPAAAHKGQGRGWRASLQQDPGHEDPPVAAGSLGRGLGVRAQGGVRSSQPPTRPSHTQQQQQVQNTKINALPTTPPTSHFPHRCQRRLAPRSPHACSGSSAAAPRAGASAPHSRAGTRGGAAPAEQRGGGRHKALVWGSRAPALGGCRPPVLRSRAPASRGHMSPRFWGGEPWHGGDATPPALGSQASAPARCKSPVSGARVSRTGGMQAPGFGVPSPGIAGGGGGGTSPR